MADAHDTSVLLSGMSLVPGEGSKRRPRSDSDEDLRPGRRESTDGQWYLTSARAIPPKRPSQLGPGVAARALASITENPRPSLIAEAIPGIVHVLQRLEELGSRGKSPEEKLEDVRAAAGETLEYMYISRLLAPLERPKRMNDTTMALLNMHARMRSSFISKYARVIANLGATLLTAQRLVAFECASVDIQTAIGAEGRMYTSLPRAPIGDRPPAVYDRVAVRAIEVVSKLVRVQCTRVDTGALQPPVAKPACPLMPSTSNLWEEGVIAEADLAVGKLLEAGRKLRAENMGARLSKDQLTSLRPTFSNSRKIMAMIPKAAEELAACADALFEDLENFFVLDESTKGTRLTKGESLASQLQMNYIGVRRASYGSEIDLRADDVWSVISRLQMLAQELTAAVAHELSGELMRLACIGYSLSEMVSHIDADTRRTAGIRVNLGLMQQPGDGRQMGTGCIFVLGSRSIDEILNYAGISASTVRELASRLSYIDDEAQRESHARRVIAMCQRDAARDAWNSVVRAHVEMCCSAQFDPPSDDAPSAYKAVYEELAFKVDGQPFDNGVDILGLLNAFTTEWHSALRVAQKTRAPETRVKRERVGSASRLQVEPGDKRAKAIVERVAEEAAPSKRRTREDEDDAAALALELQESFR